MRIIPKEKQLQFQNWEFGVFLHFGIRSFFLHHRDWDGQEMPASAFDPDQLDCEQWARNIKDAGAAYAILVAKHHDGFANWPSKYTSYSVAAAPWKDGKGDVVREFVDACRKYELKVGLYYSPAQWTETPEVSFRNDSEYDDFFINQISELLQNYGKIDYLWFDGCGSEHHTYDTTRIIRAIREMQPEICIFNMWDPDTRWVGNEDGYADMANFSTVSKTKFSMLTEDQDVLSENMYLPAECDLKMRSTWFDCEKNEETIKSAEELFGIYEMSVGRGANMLLNIGPDRHGLLPEPDVKRLQEFGKLLRERYGAPLPFGGIEKEADGVYSVSVPEYTPVLDELAHGPLVNRLVLQEDLTKGESIRSFRVYAYLPSYQTRKICIFIGESVGHKRICSFPLIRTGKFSVEITDGDKDAAIIDMKAYCI